METCYICNESIPSSSTRSNRGKDGMEDREKVVERRQVYFKILDHLKNYDSLLPNYSAKQTIKNQNDDNRIGEKAENPFKVMFEIEQLKKRKEDLLLQSKECDERTTILQEQRNQLLNTLQQRKQQEVMTRCKDEIIRSLQFSLSQHAKYLLHLRIERALECFRAMKIEIMENPLSKQYSQHIRDVTQNPQITPKIRSWKLVGHCNISNIPLPNNGYFEHTPMDILCMGIFHIVHLLDALSMIFHIDLPHRVNVYETFHGPTISPQYQQHQSYLLFPVISYTTHSSPSTTGPSLHWTTLDMLRKRQLKKDRRLQNLKKPAQQIKGKQPVQHQDDNDDEDDDKGTDNEYIMNPNFYQALLLLQANILVLCSKLFQSQYAAGDESTEKMASTQVIEPEHFFPPMAMLLNLKLLEEFCASIVSVPDTNVTTKDPEESKHEELFNPQLQSIYNAYKQNQELLRNDIRSTYTNHHYSQSRLARQVLTEYYAKQEELRYQQEHPEHAKESTTVDSSEDTEEVEKLLSHLPDPTGLVEGLDEDGFVEIRYGGSSSDSDDDSEEEENDASNQEMDHNVDEDVKEVESSEPEEEEEEEEETILWSSDHPDAGYFLSSVAEKHAVAATTTHEGKKEYESSEELSDDDFLTPDSTSPLQSSGYFGEENKKTTGINPLLTMETLLGKDNLASYFFGKLASSQTSSNSSTADLQSNKTDKNKAASKKYQDEEDDWDIIDDDM